MTLSGRILITGGSGTLGNAIVDRCYKAHPNASLTVFSRSEHKQAEMRKKYPDVQYILGDVRDYDRVDAAIVGNEIVIHAAALKRLPECAENPSECFATNVQGSANVLRACRNRSVAQVLGISTDKACRAVTTYGASKLLMEGLFKQFSHAELGTKQLLVRYGNIVGSEGSVLPHWRKLSLEGRPITVTEPQCTRFWMHISDAVLLIEDALSYNLQGATIIPKMKSMSLLHMIDTFQELQPERKINFVRTGFRTVEKFHEDLVSPDERCIDNGSYFILDDPMTNSSNNVHYTSNNCPSLTSQEFMFMNSDWETKI